MSQSRIDISLQFKSVKARIDELAEALGKKAKKTNVVKARMAKLSAKDEIKKSQLADQLQLREKETNKKSKSKIYSKIGRLRTHLKKVTHIHILNVINDEVAQILQHLSVLLSSINVIDVIFADALIMKLKQNLTLLNQIYMSFDDIADYDNEKKESVVNQEIQALRNKLSIHTDKIKNISHQQVVQKETKHKGKDKKANVEVEKKGNSERRKNFNKISAAKSRTKAKYQTEFYEGLIAILTRQISNIQRKFNSLFSTIQTDLASASEAPAAAPAYEAAFTMPALDAFPISTSLVSDEQLGLSKDFALHDFSVEHEVDLSSSEPFSFARADSDPFSPFLDSDVDLIDSTSAVTPEKSGVKRKLELGVEQKSESRPPKALHWARLFAPVVNTEGDDIDLQYSQQIRMEPT